MGPRLELCRFPVPPVWPELPDSMAASARMSSPGGSESSGWELDLQPLSLTAGWSHLAARACVLAGSESHVLQALGSRVLVTVLKRTRHLRDTETEDKGPYLHCCWEGA